MDSVLRRQEKLSLIEQIPLFANLPGNHKKAVAGSSLIVEYKKGDIVYKEGANPDAFYCVVTGRLRAYITRQGAQEDLEYLKRGKYFGTLSVLTGEPHSVTIQAVNDSIILKIPKEAFGKLLSRVPELGIHVGRTLSRQIKLKDGPDKKIFESTIISVFGTSKRIGTSNYIFSLGVSLKEETHKKIILLKVSKEIPTQARPLRLNSPFFDPAMVGPSIFKHHLGIDIINIPHNPKEAAYLAPLLTCLTGDYHYVLVDLPTETDDATFEALKQSDMVHLVSAPDEESLRLTAGMVDRLNKFTGGLSYKIRIITSEFGGAKTVDFAARQAILKHGIFATLPDADTAADEYSRMIRRISRQIGDCLVGLALGAGAAQGLAHIGILRVMEKENIPVDVVSGTSIGALIGAMWASGKTADKMETVFLRFKKKMGALRLIDLAIPKKGLIKGRETRRFLISLFGNKTFRDLRLPLKIVTCDIARREEVVLEEGDVSLVDAVMASMAIPGMFEPVKIGGRLLVDGGIINPLPTNVLTRAGVAKIIAVNALPSPEDVQEFKKKDFNIFDMIVRNIQASEYLLAEASSQDADIAMHPVLGGVDWYELYECDRIIKRGEAEAAKYLTGLKELAGV